jgi:hypothetical protein
MHLLDLPVHAHPIADIKTPEGIGRLMRSGLGWPPRSPLVTVKGAHSSVERGPVSHPGSHSHHVRSYIAESPAQALLARELVRKRYYRAGYRMVEDGGGQFPTRERAPNYYPIVAASAGRIVGTVTLGVDSPAGLMVDDVHQCTANRIRERGGHVCELVRLAVEDDVDSKTVLASLFHCIHRVCTLQFEVTDVVIEVVPQHVPFYRRVFGFVQASDVRLCERVGGVASMVLWLERSELERRLRSMRSH